MLSVPSVCRQTVKCCATTGAAGNLEESGYGRTALGRNKKGGELLIFPGRLLLRPMPRGGLVGISRGMFLGPAGPVLLFVDWSRIGMPALSRRGRKEGRKLKLKLKLWRRLWGSLIHSLHPRPEKWSAMTSLCPSVHNPHLLIRPGTGRWLLGCPSPQTAWLPGMEAKFGLCSVRAWPGLAQLDASTRSPPQAV